MLNTLLKKIELFFNAESNESPTHSASLNNGDSEDTALRFELETAAYGWEWASLNHEIKIDQSGNIYFKLDRRWVLQPTVTAITFIRE